jgi:phage gpG-like protein
VTYSLRIRPIVPKRFEANPQVRAQITQAAKVWQGRVLRDIKRYPPQQPTKSGYKRKGSGGLGGSWEPRFFQAGNGDIVAVVASNSPYAIWVQGGGTEGPRQTAEMARRGWQTTTDVAAKHQDEFAKTVQDALRNTFLT